MEEMTILSSFLIILDNCGLKSGCLKGVKQILEIDNELTSVGFKFRNNFLKTPDAMLFAEGLSHISNYNTEKLKIYMDGNNIGNEGLAALL